MLVQRYVAIGDSITEGVGDPLPDGSLAGWADRLAAALSRRQGTVQYANLAIRGRLTRQIREEQAAAALAHEPDLITAVVGVNDLVASKFDAAAFDREVDVLFAMLRTNGATVVAATLPDLSSIVPLPRRIRLSLKDRYTQLNRILEERAQNHGVELLHLEDLPATTDPKIWCPDRLHPNTVGHELFAKAMYQLIEGEPITATAPELPGYGTTMYARPGAIAAAGWASRYVLPRTLRRVRGKSSGDGRSAKIPQLVEVRDGVVPPLGGAAGAARPSAAATASPDSAGGPLQRVTLSAGTLEYADSGNGPPVVFLHPLLASGAHWRKVAPLVAEAGFRCVVPTLPLGAHRVPMHAEADLSPPAMARLVIDFIDELDLGPVTLVGNDTGGALAQMITASHPDKVDRLVLTSCDALEHFFPPLFRYLKWGTALPGFAWLLSRALRLKIIRRLPIGFGWLIKGPLPHDVIDGYAGPLATSAAIRRDVTAFMRGVSPHLTLDAAEQLRNFDKPALLAWARQDKVFSPALARRLAALLPNATLTWIDDAYAFTPEDQPAALAAQITAFCAQPTGD